MVDLCITRFRLKSLSKLARLVFTVTLIVFATGCDRLFFEPQKSEVILAQKEVPLALEVSEVLEIASDIVLTAQHADNVEYRLFSKSVLVKPRSFGGLHILNINELYLLDSQIEIFPATSNSSGGQSKKNIVDDFSETLKKYAERMSATYGKVSRLHMRNVKIILLQARKNRADIIITADKLIRDFNDDDSPALYNVSFTEKETPGELFAKKARWNIEEQKFVLK